MLSFLEKDVLRKTKTLTFVITAEKNADFGFTVGSSWGISSKLWNERKIAHKLQSKKDNQWENAIISG